MPSRPPLSEQELTQIRRLHAAGHCRNDIAKILERSGATISKAAAKLGLSFNREMVRAATEAKVADAKARRAELMSKLLDDADRLRGQIWEPHEYIENGGRDFVQTRWTQEEPSPMDKLKLMQAASSALSSSMRLDLHDADQQGLAAVDAWLRDITGAVETT